jgi:hypothetical protein
LRYLAAGTGISDAVKIFTDRHQHCCHGGDALPDFLPPVR